MLARKVLGDDDEIVGSELIASCFSAAYSDVF